MLWQGYY